MPHAKYRRRSALAVGLRRSVAAVVALAVVCAGLQVSSTPRAVAEEQKPPTPQQYDFAETTRVSPRKLTPAKVKAAEPPKVSWPQATEDVKVTPSKAGQLTKAEDTPVAVRRLKADPGPVSVSVLSREKSERLIGLGVVVEVKTKPSTTVGVAIDTAQIRGAAGGDFGGRARLVALPACAATDSSKAACRTTEPVDGLSVAAKSVSGEVTTDDAGVAVLALMTASSSDQGSYGATSLSPATSWEVGGSSGSFGWSYPLTAPNLAGPVAPALAIGYNSGVTDGAVSTTNNQASWLGEGFDLPIGFIERKYVPCGMEKGPRPGGNEPSGSEDLCWATESARTNNARFDNAVLALQGHSGTLVRINNTASWRLENDDGTRVEKIGTIAAGNESWKVITPDGTQYFFGKGKADGASAAATHSVLKVPVAGNHSGEPGHASSFSSSFTEQPYRWNLDYVVDPTGDTMTFYYAKATNKYNKAGSTPTTYDRSSTLIKIHYGERQGSEGNSPAAKVEFTTSERCDSTISATCATATPTTSTMAAWPDVPMDAVCDATFCPSIKDGPTFFTRHKLNKVATFVQRTDSSTYDPVDSWAFDTGFPDSGDPGSAATLWLNSITHTGHTGPASQPTITMPSVTLEPVFTHNRVDGPSGTYGMLRPRLARIFREGGGVTAVTYSDGGCTPTTLPSNPATNTTRCFPNYYAAVPGDTPEQNWFSKYVVAKVEEFDTSTEVSAMPGITGLDLSTSTVTTYTYSGGAAWHFDDTILEPGARLTWNSWRGYKKVVTAVGKSGAEQSVTESTYYRGMYGDRANDAGTATKTDTITDSAGTTVNDDKKLSGQVRETRVLKAVGGSPDSRSIFDHSITNVTGADDGLTKAAQIDIKTTRSTQFLTSGSRSRTITVKARDSWGQPTQVEDTGDTAVTGDETCTRTSYATPSGSALAINLIADESVMPELCSVAVAQATVISWIRNLYDGASSPGAVTGPGFLTATQQLTGSSTRTWRTNITTTFDQHGRPVSLTDALGRTTTTTFTPAAIKSATKTEVTSPDPDGAGPATRLTGTVFTDTRRNVEVKSVAPAGETTETERDAMGRVTAVWKPGRARADSASVTYSYTVNSPTGVSTVTTNTLTQTSTGLNYVTSVELLDSLLRPRQTQAHSPSNGIVVTDTFHDSRGLVALTGTYTANSAPSTSLIAASTWGDVKPNIRITRDYAGRTLTHATYSGNTLQYQTNTAYGGNTVKITPPTGAPATTTTTDIQGRTTKLTQHLAADSTTTYTYTPASQLASMTDPKGNKWSYTYDVQGNQLTATDPDKGTTTTTYNAVDIAATVKDARNKGIAYTYDALGRVTSTTDLAGTTQLTSAAFNPTNGRAISSTRYVKEPAGTATIAIRTTVDSYDAAGRPTATTLHLPTINGLVPAGLAGDYTVNDTYHPTGQLATTALPATGPVAAETLTYGYNTRGAGYSLTGASSYVKSSSYTQYGDIAAVNMGSVADNSIFLTYDHNQATGRLTTARTITAAGTVDNTAYAYDPAGNITNIKATLLSGTVDNQCFTYDAQQQLKAAWTAAATANCATTPTQSTLGSGPSPYWTTWATDTIGKTSSRTDKTATTTATTAYTHPANSATAVRPHSVTKTVTTGTGAATRNYTYDAAGNTLTRPGPTGATQTLTYDDEGKLTKVTTGTTINSLMVYDPSGNRILKKEGDTTTLTVAGAELRFNAATSTADANRYYAFQGATIAVRTGNTADKLLSVATDHQGTPHHQIRNDNSTVTTSWQNPFGASRGAPPTGWAGEQTFVGGSKDSTGLIHIGARDYDPQLQRFTTVDPILALTNPLQWNGYTYSENNPTTFSDPTGLSTSSGGGGGSPPRQPPPMASPGFDYPASSGGYAKRAKRTTKKWPNKHAANPSGSSQQDWSPPANRAPAPPAPEFKWPDPAKMLEGANWKEIGHVALDLAGLVPGVGEIADGINALWYAAEGDWVNAAFSAAGMVPGLGMGAIAAKYATKHGGRVIKAGVAAAESRPAVDDLVEVWRAVGFQEAERIRKTGRYEYGPTEVKYFFRDMEDAVKMAKDKLFDGSTDVPQTVTRGLVRESVIARALAHESVDEGVGWVTREGDGIVPKICDVVCILVMP
ncbi:RHS repeat-associated core domain-containing protein [Micropruina sp.]|uniref:RHS repeat-associated core domain-containing protein n=1 Tax=Micropruina sp. TaxID=2737536 RepID=UPI0039E5F971